jgi:ABC-type dipeptide/oligopeptide/nickel transport system permease subunit
MNTPAASMASAGLWTLAWRRLLRDRVGMVSLALVCGYLLIVIAAAAGIVAGDWAREAGVNYASPVFVGAGDSAPQAIAAVPAAPAVPSEPGIVDPLAGVLAELRQNLAAAPPEPPRAATLPLGGDKWGRDVLKKAVKGTETSMIVGLVAALLAVAIATVMGAYAGYYGGRIDDFLNWLYSVFTAIPYLLLVLAIAAVLNQKGTLTVILILGLTGWTGIFRLVRAEYIKHRSREYVLAADAVGASDAQRMFVHILPNVSHVVLVQLSLHVVLFIKMEVILSFLGFGVGVDTVSWGSMLNESQAELILGKWWQLAAATVAMAVLVTAFSLFTDALRDALDPRLK